MFWKKLEPESVRFVKGLLSSDKITHIHQKERSLFDYEREFDFSFDGLVEINMKYRFITEQWELTIWDSGTASILFFRDKRPIPILVKAFNLEERLQPYIDKWKESIYNKKKLQRELINKFAN